MTYYDKRRRKTKHRKLKGEATQKRYAQLHVNIIRRTVLENNIEIIEIKEGNTKEFIKIIEDKKLIIEVPSYVPAKSFIHNLCKSVNGRRKINITYHGNSFYIDELPERVTRKKYSGVHGCYTRRAKPSRGIFNKGADSMGGDDDGDGTGSRDGRKK